MGLIKAFSGSIAGTFADQWTEIITAGLFTEHSVVVAGVLKNKNNGRGSNVNGSSGVLSKGSKIFVPENTAAIILNQAGIEDIITEPGGYTYDNGQSSIFHNDESEIFNKFKKSIVDQISKRIEFGGQTGDQKEIIFVNLREIRGIKFGTKAPQIYNDLFYGTDLSIQAYGSFSLQVVDAKKFVQKFVPANTKSYSFDNKSVRAQILSEFLQSFTVALNNLSSQFRISQISSQSNEIVRSIKLDEYNAGSWLSRFGFQVVSVGIENIELSDESKDLVQQYSRNKMNVKAYDDISQKSSNIASQQNISQGIKSHGLGDAGGMVYGMNFAQALNSNNSSQKSDKSLELSFEEQVKNLKQLKILLDEGIINEDEFSKKKAEIMGF